MVCYTENGDITEGYNTYDDILESRWIQSRIWWHNRWIQSRIWWHNRWIQSRIWWHARWIHHRIWWCNRL